MEPYELSEAISKTGLDKIDSSPLDYWWHFRREDRDPYTPDKQTIFDNALRMAVFNPSGFYSKYVRTPAINKSTNIGKSEFSALQKTADFNGQILLTLTDFDNIVKMQDAIMKHPTAKLLCGAGQVGQAVRFHEGNTGAPVKFIPHWIHSGGIIVNLMSTKDASLHNFQKEAYNFRHDKKAVIQMEGLQLDGMAFISIEPDPPFKIGLRFLDDRALNFGRETVVRNCATYLQCLESGIWKGFDEQIVRTSLPDWAFKL